jgi:ankyrin repeat protein
MRACRKSSTRIASLLLSNGADTSATDQYGATALIIAASEADGEIVDLLLQNGADPAVKDKNGWTAFMWAQSIGAKDIAERLALG